MTGSEGAGKGLAEGLRRPPLQGPSNDPSAGVWVRRPETLWRTAGDTVALLPDGQEARPLVVAGSAAMLWELLAAPVSLGELVGELARRYGADRAVIERDLLPVLEQLCSSGAIERRP